MLFRVSLVLLVGVMMTSVAAGCGGSDQGRELATGVVKSFEQEDRRLKLKSQGEEMQVFKYNPENIEVSLDGEGAAPEDIEEGQRATISYVVKNDRQLARSIELEEKK